jgi:hypothetical protein
MNAYIHGVYAKIMNMTDEDMKKFIGLRDGLIEQFGPKYPTEFDLIDKLTMSYFRDFQFADSVVIMMDLLPLMDTLDDKKKPFVSPVDPEAASKKARLGRRTKYLTLDDQLKVMKLQSIINAETRKTLKDLRAELAANDTAEAEVLAEEEAEQVEAAKTRTDAAKNDNEPVAKPRSSKSGSDVAE